MEETLPHVTLAILATKIENLTAQVATLSKKVDSLSDCFTGEQISATRTDETLKAIRNQLTEQDKKIKELEDLMETYVPVAKTALWLAAALTVPAILALFGFISGLITHKITIGF